MGMYVFNPEDARRFAHESGIKVHERGNELFFQECPFCHGNGKGNNNSFSISLITGQYHCFRGGCGESGNMLTLSHAFDWFSLGQNVDEYYQPRRKFKPLANPPEPIKPKEEAVRYLSDVRKIPKEIAERYEITVQTDNKDVLVFPFYDEKGQLQFIKYRDTQFGKSKSKNKEWCESGHKPILFGMKQCVNFDQLVITEGQLDSLSVATAGIDNAVSVPNGANGFTWVPYCFDWVRKFSKLVVFGDLVDGEITLLEELNRHFPDILYHVRPEDYQGCKDANEILQEFGPDAIKKAVENAVKMPVRRVIHLSDVKRENIYEIKKLKTGLPTLDDILGGGLPFGSLCVLAGKRGEGKSTLASQILVNSVEQGYTTFAYSGEMQNADFRSWFDLQATGPDNLRYRPYPDIDAQTETMLEDWYRDRMLLYDNRIVDDDEEEDLLMTLEKAIQQYSVQVILIDNLMTAMYIDADPGTNKYEQQGVFTQRLAKMAMKYGVLIILVAHQRKNSSGDDFNDEVSGSADITNLAGVTLGYVRGTPKDLESGRIVKEGQSYLVVAKNRLFGKLSDGIPLNFDPDSKRIYENAEGLHYRYGWENFEISDPDSDDDFFNISEEDAAMFKD